MTFAWPEGVDRVPDEAWTRRPVAELARKYDSVENHGWYDNLEPTVDQLSSFLEDGNLVLDYSSGTGILVDRLRVALGRRRVGILAVDSSPKFLRLAIDKLGDDEDVAFRRIRYLSGEGRLAYVDEVLEDPLLERGVDAVASTNAIHLYHDLVETLAAWRRVLNPGGRAFVQSGNVDRADRPADRWVIDATVEGIAEEARAIAREDERFEAYRERLDDDAWMRAHREYRERVFPPIRGLDHYRGALEEAGFEVRDVDHRAIEARVDEWVSFLSTYADAVVGWVGGAEKVTDKGPGREAREDRRALLEAAAERVFGGARRFTAEWTYLVAEPA